MHHLVISKEQMKTMKKIMELNRIHLPNTTELNEARKKLCPVVTTILDDF